MQSSNTAGRASPLNTTTILIVVSAIFLTAGATLASIGPALPALAALARQELATMGALFSAISSGVVLAQFVAGPASDRYGQRVAIGAGLLLMGAGTLGVGIGLAFWPMLACSLLLGFGFGNLLASGNVLVARLFPARSAAALNGVNIFFGIGSFVGPALVGVAGRELAAPQLALWWLAAALLLLAPVALRSLPALPAATPPKREGGRGGRMAVFWLLGLLLLVYTGTEVGFGGWVTLYMMTSVGMPPASAALVASGFWLALTVGRALAAGLGMRLGSGALLAASLAVALAGAGVLITSVGQLERTLLAVALLGLAYGPMFPTVLAVVTRAAQGSSALTGIALVVGNCGGLLIPNLLGRLLAGGGPPSLARFVLGASVAMIALSVVVALAHGSAARVGPPAPADHAP